ncbi:hypothetical protein TSUD_300500 [Trifolium subterraneum]|uniref:Uncharacterized protein n=1 Tax=Trifolium subterraneum TaxID=3900 RepID=A0A2Z6NB71_TRISU|nr:hypothetical protein TSUD_300500 [Trifolium subterraneum]
MTKNNTERIEIAQRGNTQNDEHEKLQISVLTEKRGGATDDNNDDAGINPI